MNQSTINTRYAKALFKLAKEKNVISRTLDDMKVVFETFDKITELSAVIEDPVITTAKKTGVIQSVFKSNISDISLSFLVLIINNKRELYIKGIARYFLELVKKDQGIKTVVLTTAHEINKKQKENIIALIKKEIKSEIELTELINEDIIGGFVLRIDDTQYDSSVRSELKKIKKSLLETTIEK